MPHYAKGEKLHSEASQKRKIILSLTFMGN
jgi:hypothetical protein